MHIWWITWPQTPWDWQFAHKPFPEMEACCHQLNLIVIKIMQLTPEFWRLKFTNIILRNDLRFINILHNQFRKIPYCIGFVMFSLYHNDYLPWWNHYLTEDVSAHVEDHFASVKCEIIQAHCQAPCVRQVRKQALQATLLLNILVHSK